MKNIGRICTFYYIKRYRHNILTVNDLFNNSLVNHSFSFFIDDFSFISLTY